ncbi:MAG: transposase, partial [Luteolibacter sp.]
GRGGAGFPLSFKWNSCREVEAGPKYVVCNADEGDPGAYIDKYLMEERPHSVLLGMMVCGWFIGAEVGVLYVRAEYPDSIRILEESFGTFDGVRYELHCRVVMPNHVHVLFSLKEGMKLEKVMATWKNYTASRINAELG